MRRGPGGLASGADGRRARIEDPWLARFARQNGGAVGVGANSDGERIVTGNMSSVTDHVLAELV
jgi:hypothetical protein